MSVSHSAMAPGCSRRNACGPDAKEAEQMATACNHGLFYQPSNSHPGTLPMESSLLGARTESGVISAVLPGEDGKILVRAYGTAAEKEEIALRFGPSPCLARPYCRPGTSLFRALLRI